MNTYEAIMRAADQIEREPGSFAFHSKDKPCPGMPGCALGWIGYFAGMADRGGQSYPADVARNYLAIPEMEFYRRMNEIRPTVEPYAWWTFDTMECVARLRLYAEKYHAPEQGLPEIVREIFTGQKELESV